MSGYVDETSAHEDSAFKKTFKLYRNISPDTCTDLIDFDNVDDFGHLVRRRLLSTPELDENVEQCFQSLYLKWPPSEWNAYEIDGKPGLIFLRNPFVTMDGHFYWSRRCLVDYTRCPNVASNVDTFMERRNIKFEGSSIFNDKVLLKKLRWLTLGYHHNWNTKVYEEGNRSEVPNDLRQLSATVAQCLFRPLMHFNAEAVIVNFYRMNSTLAGHVDSSEKNFDWPLLSFSFGQSAIFMVGGRTLNETPIAVKVRSGDIVVMHGECRLAYHAVPRIFHEGDTRWQGKGKCEIADYLNENRINVNVRRVN